MPVGYMVLASIFLYHYWHSMGDMVIITPGAFTSRDIFLVPALIFGSIWKPTFNRTHYNDSQRNRALYQNCITLS